MSEALHENALTIRDTLRLISIMTPETSGHVFVGVQVDKDSVPADSMYSITGYYPEKATITPDFICKIEEECSKALLTDACSNVRLMVASDLYGNTTDSYKNVIDLIDDIVRECYLMTASSNISEYHEYRQFMCTSVADSVTKLFALFGRRHILVPEPSIGDMARSVWSNIINNVCYRRTPLCNRLLNQLYPSWGAGAEVQSTDSEHESMLLKDSCVVYCANVISTGDVSNHIRCDSLHSVQMTHNAVKHIVGNDIMEAHNARAIYDIVNGRTGFYHNLSESTNISGHMDFSYDLFMRMLDGSVEDATEEAEAEKLRNRVKEFSSNIKVV